MLARPFASPVASPSVAVAPTTVQSPLIGTMQDSKVLALVLSLPVLLVVPTYSYALTILGFSGTVTGKVAHSRDANHGHKKTGERQ